MPASCAPTTALPEVIELRVQRIYHWPLSQKRSPIQQRRSDALRHADQAFFVSVVSSPTGMTARGSHRAQLVWVGMLDYMLYNANASL